MGIIHQRLKNLHNHIHNNLHIFFSRILIHIWPQQFSSRIVQVLIQLQHEIIECKLWAPKISNLCPLYIWRKEVEEWLITIIYIYFPCIYLWWRLQSTVWSKMESLIICNIWYQCQVTQVVKDNLVLILGKASVQMNLDAQYFAYVILNILWKIELYFLAKSWINSNFWLIYGLWGWSRWQKW